ncbi:MAG: hypothetical protein AB4062_18760, partial [Crocosphaera sp.]
TLAIFLRQRQLCICVWDGVGGGCMDGVGGGCMDGVGGGCMDGVGGDGGAAKSEGLVASETGEELLFNSAPQVSQNSASSGFPS